MPSEADLDLSDRDEYLVSDNFHFSSWGLTRASLWQSKNMNKEATITHNDGLLLLAQSFLAEKHNCCLEDKTHCMKFQPLRTNKCSCPKESIWQINIHFFYSFLQKHLIHLFNLSEEVWNVEPLNPTVVQKVPRGKVDRLSQASHWLYPATFASSSPAPLSTFAAIYLFTGLLMLPEEVIKYCTVFLMNPLHLINVLGNLLHSYERLYQVLVLVGVGVCQVLGKNVII